MSVEFFNGYKANNVTLYEPGSRVNAGIKKLRLLLSSIEITEPVSDETVHTHSKIDV